MKHDWETVIGLEVHAQIVSTSKLFSGSSTPFGSDPNTQVSFFDAAMPGMLPVLNQACVDQAIKTGLGFGGTINRLSIFDRKNYFYPDNPSGYQISQYSHPIVSGGKISIDLENGETKEIAITRLHLEKDAGKSIHDLHPERTYIDLNRAGIALMEIVSEPDLRSAYEAMAYVKKLRALLRYLGTCDGNMQEGSLRVDVNVSLRRFGESLGTRAEIKNVNSIKFLGQAVTYEISRQQDLLESGQEVVQETRLFDPAQGITRSMRGKENAHDYRYFPDPDLKPLILSLERIEALRQTLPEFPDAKKSRFMTDYHLSVYDADVLVSEQEYADYFESVLAFCADPFKSAKMLANWFLSELLGVMKMKNVEALADLPFSPQDFAELITLIQDGTISGKIAKDIFPKMWEREGTPKDIVERLGLRQISDASSIEPLIERVLNENARQVEAYRAGKIQLLGFFVGQVMQKLQGKGNPEMINAILKEKLNACVS